MSQKIVVATGNAGKLREFEALFTQYGLTNAQLVSLADYKTPDYQEPEENSPCFLGNALIKAYAASELTGLPAMADDSGICVDFLKGAPGIYSSRFASMHNFDTKGLDQVTKDQHNYLQLLEMLKDVKDPNQRGAHFFCCLVLVRHPQDPTPLVAFGRCEGRILEQAHGNGGHGYDPVFFSLDLNKSFGEASMDEKNHVSHRTRSFKELVENGLRDFINSAKS